MPALTAWRPSLQNLVLMTQHNDLRLQPLSRPEAVAHHTDEREADCNHAAIMLLFAANRQVTGGSFRKRHLPNREPVSQLIGGPKNPGACQPGAHLWDF